MLGSIISAIIDGILNAAISWLQGLAQRRADRKQGAQEQAAADTASSEKTETAIAQAEADATRSQSGLAEAAKEGKF